MADPRSRLRSDQGEPDAVDRAEETRSRAASMRAGMAAGIAGFAVFLLIHHLWIVPIWFIAPVGGLLAAAGGATVGVAYADLLPHLPRRPWRAIAMAGAVGIVLLPAFVIAEFRGPIFAIERGGGGPLLVSGTDAAALVVGSLAAATIVGAGLGWLIGRRRRAAGTMALAAFVFATGPGHNIPLLGGTPAVAKELAILAAVVGLSSVVLVEGHAWLVRLRPALASRPGGQS
jgi:hypothetical protein